METNVKVIGFSNKRINGKTLDSKGFDLDYDGNYLDVNAFNNERQYYTRLDNEDIMHLLNIPSSQMPLEQRIMQFNLGSNYDKSKLMQQPMFMESNQIQKPNQVIMYYKSKPKYKTRRLSLNRQSRKTPKMQKITYARVSSIKRPSSKISRKSMTKSRNKSINSKPVSSIRQTIY